MENWKAVAAPTPSLSKNNGGGQPVRPILWSAPATPPPPLLTALSNHRDDILRDRIKGRHRLRVRLECPLGNDQISKLCCDIDVRLLQRSVIDHTPATCTGHANSRQPRCRRRRIVITPGSR